MIGIFDSGSGGLTLLQECRMILPEYDYLYFGDYKNCPYGNKSFAQVYELTKLGVLKLRDAGATIVILACNTATSASIRKLQKQEESLGVKVLGVTIPAAEKVVERKYKKISVFATHASVKNKLYKSRVGILDKTVQVQEIGLTHLATFIEKFLKNEMPISELEEYIREKTKYVWKDSEAVVLGCTHYSHIKSLFQKIFPEKDVICPSYESAIKFKQYLEKHTGLEQRLTKTGAVVYLQ